MAGPNRPHSRTSATSLTMGADDEERERDTERHARLHEADEQRHRGAGAERRDDAEPRGGGRADHDVAAGERPAHPLGGHEGAQEADGGHDAHQEQHHLGQVEQEEGERGAEALAGVEAQHVGREPVDRGRQQDPGDEPRGDAGRHGDPERDVDPCAARSGSVVIAGAPAASPRARGDRPPRRARSTSSARRRRDGWRARARHRAASRGGC